jgi:hypothetical protein
MTDERSKPIPNEGCSSPYPVAEESLSIGGSFLEGQGTSTTLFLKMPKVPEFVWSWIRQYEAAMTNASCADATLMRRTSTENGQAAMKEARHLTCPKGCQGPGTGGCSGD